MIRHLRDVKRRERLHGRVPPPALAAHITREEGGTSIAPRMVRREEHAPSGLALLAHLPQNCWGRLGVPREPGSATGIWLTSATALTRGLRAAPSPASGRGDKLQSRFAGCGAVLRTSKRPGPCPTPTSPSSFGGGASLSERRGRPRTQRMAAWAPRARGYNPRRRILRCPSGEFIRSWWPGRREPALAHSITPLPPHASASTITLSSAASVTRSLFFGFSLTPYAAS
jgi:hypothetical protein